VNIEERLSDTFTAHEHLAPDAASLLRDIQRQLQTAPPRHRARNLAAISASVAVVAVIAGVVVAVARGGGGSHQPVAPVNTVPPASSATGTVAVDPGLPTDPGTPIPVSQYQIAITHTGAYDYTSPALPITHAPNAMGLGFKIINGEARIREDRAGGVRITQTPDGTWVIEAKFSVISFTGNPVLQFDNAFVEGTAGR
jgi:hypothetical protein